MTLAQRTWQLDVRIEPTLPPLAWVATVSPGQLKAACGPSVRTHVGGFFEGTWAGPAGEAALPEATTVFGSGIVVHGHDLLVITPSHHLEGVYVAELSDRVLLSNSLVAVLTAAGLELDPEFDYPSLFASATALCWLIDDASIPGRPQLIGSQVIIPTRTQAVTGQYFENLRIGDDLTLTEVRKRREPTFESFADYSERLVSAMQSAISNAGTYEPVVALSSGYDSTASAVVAAEAGCRVALGLRTSRPAARDGSVVDTGAGTAELLGMSYQLFDRLAYFQADGFPEAEFLANGMTAEDIIFRAFEPVLRGKTLLTGYWAGTQFAMSHSDDWQHVSPTSTAGADMGEFRLRADFYHVLPPLFGATQEPGAPRLLDRAEMEPYRVQGHYDRPIPRRLAEEAGVSRQSFGMVKRAANVLFQRDGLAAFTPRSRRSLEEFARSDGRSLDFRIRRQTHGSDRAAIALAHRLGLARLARPLERRRASLVHFEREFGTLVFRWAVSVVAQRYRAVAGSAE
jgi:hypothetical protein